MIKKKKIIFHNIHTFPISLAYVEGFYTPGDASNVAHIHDQFEIYVNVEGNVSFLVGNNIYPIKRGSVIFTRPNEYHHCIYHDNEIQKHYVIWFSAAENEYLLRAFLSHKKGTNNLIAPEEDAAEELLSICYDLLHQERPLGQQLTFLRLLDFLDRNLTESEEVGPSPFPADMRLALAYMEEHLAAPFTIKDMADYASVSVNTLERHFKDTLQISPTELIKRNRLALAADLLRSGCSVQEAATRSGFQDISRFIALFREYFHMTPLKYKKGVSLT